MFVRANFVDIYSQGMRDKSMRSGTELAREIKLTDWSMAGNLSNRSSGGQIPRDICTRLKRYLYSSKCSWIIKDSIASFFTDGWSRVICRVHSLHHQIFVVDASVLQRQNRSSIHCLISNPPHLHILVHHGLCS